MWCENCEIMVNSDKCPYCDKKTRGDIPVRIMWCDTCKVPIIQQVNAINKDVCHNCNSEVNYMCKDMRPVFPEERLLIGILEGKPLKYMEKSVWCSTSRYYINGKVKNISSKIFDQADIKSIQKQLKEHNVQKYYDAFNLDIQNCVNANLERVYSLKQEAYTFINESINGYDRENIIVSFSGGKDSTVVSDLVVKSLGTASITHIFGDTTLEFPLTMEYVKRYRADNPNMIMKVAKNKEKDFLDMCGEIGPPSRLMRWCCTMFKTGPISRVLSSMYKDRRVLTFYGIRKSESASRSKYERIYESPKILRQTVAAPIFNWTDADVWLYMLAEKVDFNDAYKYGYDRVGCWCCPNNSGRSHFLSKIYIPEHSERWRNFLIDFAKGIGKPDAEVYIDEGKWKARQGGIGVEASKDIEIIYTNCTTDANSQIYKLNKPIDDDFLNMFIPFGIVSKELGRKLIGEVIVLDIKTNMPIISIQPFSSQEYDIAVKIQTLNIKKHDKLQKMIGYQVRKYNACRKCLACEAVCSFRAISVSENGYRIHPDRCRRCMKCVTAKYLEGGCLMRKYLYVAEEYKGGN